MEEWGTGRATGGPTLDGSFQNGPIDRLGNVIVHSGRNAPFAIASHRVCGHGDYRDMMIAHRSCRVANQLCSFVAIQTWQLAIHEHEVIVHAPERAQRDVAVGGHVGSISEVLQHAQGDILIGLVILN